MFLFPKYFLHLTNKSKTRIKMKKITLFLVFIALISCNKDDDSTPADNNNNNGTNPTNPELTTTAVSDITSSGAKSGGVITSDGGLTISERGVCWGTLQNPTVNNNSFTSDGNGIGTFESNITGLQPNTQYYVRAFVKNSSGVYYGDNQTFTTLASIYDGIYNEEGSSFKYIEVLSNGDNLEYHFFNDPSVFVGYENRGKYELDTEWYKFLPTFGVAASTLYVVKQVDENTIKIRRHELSYNHAYDEGEEFTYIRN